MNGYANANTLNAFFASVFTRENIDDNVPFLQEGGNSQGMTLSEIRVTPAAVTEKLGKLNKDKAQGPDNIPPRVLVELCHTLGEPLSVLYNKSLEMGRIPADWKTAHVTAIFKKGTKSTAGNYRPVSLTCVLCKVLESIIRDAMVNHMNDHKLYSSCQHGFRKGRSCTTQLLEVMENLSRSIDDGQNIDILYLDFRKAFDQVPHHRLLLKLRSYGFVGNISKWIEDFLSDRTQKVRVGDSYSANAKVLSGIPQGSILGPILFTEEEEEECFYSTIQCNTMIRIKDIYREQFGQETPIKMQLASLSWEPPTEQTKYIMPTRDI